MTVVLDCNILVTCLSSRSPYHKIYNKLIDGAFSLAVTNEIVLEYEEIIQQKYSWKTANAFTILLSELPNVVDVVPYFKWNLISVDPDDNKYCDCAINSNSDFIVTQDIHFKVLENYQFPHLQVISIFDFIKII
jgi:uncharacterized protein